MSCRTFIRSARDFEEFARAVKTTVQRGLTVDEARDMCREYNDNRTSGQRSAGTKMEFEEEGQ